MKKKHIAAVISVILVICTAFIMPLQTVAQTLEISSEETAAGENTNSEQEETAETEPEIIAELTGQRDANTKRFILSDGTYMAAQYDEPIHYQNAEGEWVDYDNTMVITDPALSSENQEYENKSSDQTVKLAKKAKSDKTVTYKYGDYELSWGYEGTNKSTVSIIKSDNELSGNDRFLTLSNVSQEARYADILDGVDLDITVSTSKIKENIILKNSGVINEFTVNYKLKNLTAVQADERTINLQNAGGETVYVISAPYMYDANGEISNGITLSVVEQKNNKLVMKITADSEWLSEPDRAFPVTVDPVMTTEQYGTSNCESAFVAENYPNSSFGYGGNTWEGSLYAGYENFKKTSSTLQRGVIRSYLKCNNLPTLSPCDVVIDARVNLCYNRSSFTSTVGVYKVTSDWSQSSITWNTQPSVSSYINLDYKKIPYSGTYDPKWMTWEITSLVREWYLGKSPNYGIQFRADNESPDAGRAWFFSTGYPDAMAVRPIITIQYRNMSGYENYYSYTSVNAGAGGTASVNNYNGNLTFTQSLTEDCGGELMPVNISFVYNSNKSGQAYSNIGLGSQTNYHINISRNTNTSGLYSENFKYYLNDADGTAHYFYFENSSDTTAKDEDGLGYTISVNESVAENDLNSTRYTVTDKDGNTMLFNGFGYITTIRNSGGLTNTVEYSIPDGSSTPRISCIKDGAGRSYVFDYYDNTTIKGITDPSGRYTYISYWEYRPSSIVLPDGTTTTFYYNDSAELITDIKLISNNVEQHNAYIVYNEQSVIKNVSKIGTTSVGGRPYIDYYEFDYNQNETRVNDLESAEYNFANGLSINTRCAYIYQFNDYGQCTGIISGITGQGQFFEYDNSSSSKVNKVKSSSKLQSSTVNYIINPSVSRDLSGSYTEYSEVSQENFSIYRDTTIGHFSPGSIKIQKNSQENGRVFETQIHYGLSAGIYTLSAYVKSGEQETTGVGATLCLEVWGENGIESNSWVPVSSSGGEWERYSVTVDLAEGKTLKTVFGYGYESGGTIWFDDLQLERGIGETSFNLLENSGFTNGTSQWSVVENSQQLWTISANEHPTIRKACLMNGLLANGSGKGEQTIAVSGNQNDVFCIGGWGEAVSAPLDNGTKDGDEYIPQFKLRIEFYRSDYTYINGYDNKFNPDVYSWQFNSFKAIAPENYSYIKIIIDYSHNINNLFFADLYCYKEEYGQTYVYDNDGNIVSTSDLAKTQSDFAYYGNQMTKLLNPSGSRYMYTYDDEKKLTNALSSDGQEYSFTYDSYDNLTSSSVKSRKAVTSIESGKEYYIVNSYSGMAMDSGWIDGYPVTTYNYDPASPKQKWKAISTGEDNVFRFQAVDHPGNGNYMLDVCNESAEQGAIIQNYIEHETPAQKFKVVQKNENTFGIFTACSNYEKCLDGQLDTGNTIIISQTVKQAACDPNNLPEGMRWYFYEVSASDSTAGKEIRTTAEYTENGNFLSKTTDALGNETSYSYNQNNGQLQSATDAKGNVTSYSYDPATNRLTSVTSGGVTNSYEYNSQNLLSQITASGNLQYRFEYDDFGRTTAVKVGYGDSFATLMTTSYDAYSRPTVKTYGNGVYTWTAYDSLDRVTEIRYNNDISKRITYAYSTNGNLSLVTDYFAGTKTKYTYDLSGRVVAIRTYGSTGLSYNTDLRSELKYKYADRTNYLVGVSHYTPELGTQNTTYRYGDISQGEMPDQVYSVSVNGVEKQSYVYDGLGRIVTEQTKASDGVVLNNTYSYKDVENSNRTSAVVSEFTNAYGSYSYEYDANGNIISIAFTRAGENTVSETVSYEYDSLGQLKKEIKPDFVTEYVYDGAGNILTKKIYANDGTASEPDEASVTKYEQTDTGIIYNGAWATVSSWYCSGGSLLRTRDSTASCTFTFTGTKLTLMSYKSPTRGVLCVSIDGGAATEYDCYADEYDVYYQTLIDLDDNIDPTSSHTVVITPKSTNGTKWIDVDAFIVENGVYTRTYTYGNSSWRDQLTSFDGQSISYDEIGNPTSYLGAALTWERGRTLSSYTKDGLAVSYSYNYDGQRISKTVNGVTTQFIYNGGTLAGQKTGDNIISWMYNDGGEAFGFKYNGTEYYYVKNLQGDVVAITDSNGNVIAKYSYDSWGVCTVTQDVSGCSIGTINPYRYRGYYYDSETGLYYVSSRYYDPEVGRWINSDNAISGTGKSVQGYNVFIYCFNNPVNMDDPTGNWPKWLEKAAKVVAVAAVVVTAVVVVAVATAGTGGMALAAAGVAFGTACGGLVGGIANEKKGESFISGWIGGAVNGFTQSVGTIAFGSAGTILGGGVGSGLGTAVTESLNNIGKPKEQQKSSKDILNDSLKSAAIGTAMSTITAGIGYSVNYAQSPLGYNSWSDSLKPGVGIAPITPGFGEMIKGFFSSVDDALVYIFCE